MSRSRSPQRLAAAIGGIVVFCAAIARADVAPEAATTGRGPSTVPTAVQERDVADAPWRYSRSRGLRYLSEDRALGFYVGGMLQFDAAQFDHDKETLHNGAEVHRGRLAVSGRVARDWHYRAEGDFAGSRPALVEGYLRYTGLHRIGVSAGLMKAPFSLEWQTSSKNTTFLERALPLAFAPPQRVGISIDTSGSRWSAAAGGFGRTMGNASTEDRGWGVAGRVSYAPVERNGAVLHLGLSGAYRAPDQGFNHLRIRARPEAHLADISFVDSRTIRAVDNYTVLGAEFAGARGPTLLQAEYIHSFVNRAPGRSDLQFDGWYVFGSWFITGESHSYDARRGRFGMPTPVAPISAKDGSGAWEVAVRYSQIDLNDAPVHGGAQHDVTYALNWYPIDRLRLMANYVIAKTDANATGRRNHGHATPSIFELRAQLEF